MNFKKCTPVLFVKDAKQSRNFYVDILGMTVTADFGGLNYSFEEGFAIWQILDGNVVIETLGRNNIENSQSTNRFEICFETETLDSIFKALKENNVMFLHEVNTEIWGQRTIRLYDPDGHLIEIGETMPVFLKRIYDEEGQNLEATSKRSFMPIEGIKHFLGL